MITIIFFIFSLLVCLIGIYYYQQSKIYKAKHDYQQTKEYLQLKEKLHKINIEIFLREKEIQQLEEKEKIKTILENDIKTAEKQRESIISQYKKEEQRYNNLLTKAQQQIDNYDNTLKRVYNGLKQNYEIGYNSYVKELDNAYLQKEEEFRERRVQLEQSLDQLKNELTATAVAKRRQEEKENQLDFYKIQLTEKQIKDIEWLMERKNLLSDPSLVSKVVWSAYIMKATNALCARLTQGKTICGIYKITSLKDQKSYIGQSIDITARFKQHIKCGLGIDAPATNKLYNIMQEEGVYNFTFQIIQKCKKEKLNERERFWIQTYQTDKFGLNGTGGNKK